MKKFKTIESVAAYLPMPNIDTDMIIPKQYLKTIKRSGLGKFLFADLRYDSLQQEKKDFILNQAPFNHAQILVTQENMGCGSSREHAVWSLMDFGFKVIISPSFADIFYGNCFKNGLLAIPLSKTSIEQIVTRSERIKVNLETQMITAHNLSIPFHIQKHHRHVLLEGLDEISETLNLKDYILQFESKQKQQQPWLYE